MIHSANKRFRTSPYVSLHLLVSTLIATSSVKAENFCVSKTVKPGRNGSISLASSIKVVKGACPRNTVLMLDSSRLVGAQGSQGVVGPAGPQGADGQLRIYGDGSAGDVSIKTSINLADINSDKNFLFNNLTVEPSATLTVPSGAVIRCNKSCVINGNLNVETGTGGSSFRSPYANSGIARVAPSVGGQAAQNSIAVGGVMGIGIGVSAASTLFNVGFAGGSAGTSTIYQYNPGGGGTLVILAGQSLVVNGVIKALGEDGDITTPTTSGGGGGIVILAAKQEMTVTGQILANGGSGAQGRLTYGGGGGGGGGLVRLISPKLQVSGILSAAGGLGGAIGTYQLGATRYGGAGGGGSIGNGGRGGQIVNAPFNTVSAGETGEAGVVIQTGADPTSLF